NVKPKSEFSWKAHFNYYYYHKNGIKKRESNLTIKGKFLFEQLDSKKWFLNGEAAKQYLDYQELVLARKTATEAKKQSNVSIWLAITAIIVSAVVGIVSIVIDLNVPTPPKPPYDVKVIEDNAHTKELERTKE